MGKDFKCLGYDNNVKRYRGSTTYKVNVRKDARTRKHSLQVEEIYVRFKTNVQVFVQDNLIPSLVSTKVDII